MLYKDLMTKETYNDLQSYLETGEDAISLMGYNRAGNVDGTKLITRFQTTADPENMGRVRAFSNADVMIGVPEYADGAYSSFAVRDKSLALRFPMVGSLGAVTKYFPESQKTCPNFKSVVNDIERNFKVKVKDNERIAKPVLVKGGTIRLAGRYNGETVSEADKLVQIFNVLAKESLKDSFKHTSNPDRVQFAAELLTTMFIAESYDLGVNFNRKIDNALRLQLANTIAALGNTNKETINLIAAQTERAVAKFLKKSGKSEKDIVSTLTKLGYGYTVPPTNLYSVLFGERKNYMFTIELPNSLKDKILGKTVYVNDFENGAEQERTTMPAKYGNKKNFDSHAERPRDFDDRRRLNAGTNPTPTSTIADDMIREMEEGLEPKVNTTPDVIILPGRVEEQPAEASDVIILPAKTEPKLPGKTLEEYVVEMLDQDADYVKALEGKTKTKKPLFGGKTANKEEVSERSLKSAFDKAVVKELEAVANEVVAVFRKARGEEKTILSDIYNQLTHARQFFGKGSEKKSIKTVSAKIPEANTVKNGLVKPLEERRKTFIAGAMEYQKAMKGYAPTEDIKARVRALSDTKKIREMIETYVSAQRDRGLEQ